MQVKVEGIAGIVYPDQFQVNNLILPMLEATQQGSYVADRAFHCYNNIEIGTAGSKLAVNEKKTITGGFHGTLYNLPELRRELIQEGFYFSTENPAEAIIHAYEFWDKKFLEKIDGDFALMILDTLKKRLIIARDRIGKQPLYWHHNNNHFIFASKLKALLATGAISQAPAPDALSSYLYFGYFPQDLTPIKDTNKLLPGHYLQYNFNQSKTIEPYWSYSAFFQNPVIKHPNTIARILNQHLERSVSKRLPPKNTPVGLFVSGGLGSATAAYYVDKLLKDKTANCYTVGFEKENEKDIEAAKLVARRLNLNHQVGYIGSSNFLDDLVKIVWHLEEPIADPNIVATWKLAEMGGKSSKIVYSGMGSDELLAGHNRYTIQEQHLDLSAKLKQLYMPFIYHFVLPIVSILSRPWSYRLLKRCRTNPWQFEYISQASLFNEKMIALASPQLSGLFDPEVYLHKFHHLSRIKSKVSSFLYLDVKTRLADNYMLQVGNLARAHGLTWETPFLDQDLIEFLASLAEPEYLSEKETATPLKILMKDIFPQSVVDRPKTTRRQFLSSWMEQTKMAEVCTLLQRGTLVESGFISGDWLKQSLQSPEQRQQHYKYLWAILILEIWFQLMINRPIAYGTPEISLHDLISPNK